MHVQMLLAMCYTCCRPRLMLHAILPSGASNAGSAFALSALTWPTWVAKAPTATKAVKQPVPLLRRA